MERQGPTALNDLAQRIGVLTLDSPLKGRVTEECLSMYRVDGSMWKTVKSKLLGQFDLDPITDELQHYISLLDMHMIWHLTTPTPEDCGAMK